MDRFRNLPFYERRKRVKRPPTVLLVGLLFLVLLPIYNYVGLAYRHHTSPGHFWQVVSVLNWMEIALLLASIPVGIGILRVRAWGWWLFLLYSAALIGTNVTVAVMRAHLPNLGSTIQTVLLIAAVFYFLRKDVAAPYMKLYPRGWRFQKRRPVEVEVAIGGVPRRTRDFSPRGLYVKWPDSGLSPGDEVELTFTLAGERFEAIGGVASVTEGHGVGIAFRGVDRATQKKLRDALEAE